MKGDVEGELNNEIVAAMLELPLALWEIDMDGFIKMSVGKGLVKLGYEPGELVGANVFDLYSASPAALDSINAGLSGLESQQITHVDDVVWQNQYFPRRGKNGEMIGVYGLSMDITRQFQAERETAQANLKWRILAENAPVIITIVDSSHHATFVNHIDNIGVIDPNKRVYELLEPSHQDIARRAVEECFKGSANQEYQAPIHYDGGIHWFENRLAPIETDGEVSSIIIISTEITAKKKAEAETAAREAQELQAQKLESLGMLAGGIAHDFNNLLVGIMGYAELARLHLPEGHSANPSLDGIETAALRAAELCDQMLAYAGKGRFEMHKVDLSQLTEDFSQLLSVSLRKGVKLERHLASDLWRVEADGAQIQQVVMNLITNAADSMQGNSGSVIIRTGSGYFDQEALTHFPLVQPLPDGDYVYLEVTDSGAGMDPQTLAKMFDPFFTTKANGRGLGLSSTLAIIRGHNGSLSTQSVLGEGTTVRLFLPRAKAPKLSTAHLPTSKSSSIRSGQTVLVADDEPNVLRVATAMLQHLGFEVLAVQNGQEALDLYRLHPEIALVILDVTMPVLNGFATASELLALNPKAKIILTSGYHAENNTHPELPVLPKPYRIADMRAVLSTVLGVTLIPNS